MGPNEAEQPVMLYCGNGSILEPFKPITNIADVPKVVIDADDIPFDGPYTIGALKPAEIVGQLIPRRMSRKRFVKLLMAQGYSRNQANAFTVYGRNVGNYGLAYMLLTFSCFQ